MCVKPEEPEEIVANSLVRERSPQQELHQFALHVILVLENLNQLQQVLHQFAVAGTKK